MLPVEVKAGLLKVVKVAKKRYSVSETEVCQMVRTVLNARSRTVQEVPVSKGLTISYPLTTGHVSSGGAGNGLWCM